MPRKAPTLTGSQIQQVRANLARSVTQIGNRVSKCAMGELDMSANELNAAKVIIQNTLPAQQAVAWTDETERADLDTLQDNLAKAASQLTSADITTLLSQLSPNELQALIKGTEH